MLFQSPSKIDGGRKKRPDPELPERVFKTKIVKPSRCRSRHGEDGDQNFICDSIRIWLSRFRLPLAWRVKLVWRSTISVRPGATWLPTR